jgi:hypothetical protein
MLTPLSQYALLIGIAQVLCFIAAIASAPLQQASTSQTLTPLSREFSVKAPSNSARFHYRTYTQTRSKDADFAGYDQ